MVLEVPKVGKRKSRRKEKGGNSIRSIAPQKRGRSGDLPLKVKTSSPQPIQTDLLRHSPQSCRLLWQ